MFPETTPALANVLHWASRPTDDAETRRLIRRRLMVYVRLIVMLFGGLYAIGMVGTAIVVPQLFVAMHVHPAKVVNLLLALGALAFLQVLRRSQPSERMLRSFDVGFAFLMAIGIGVASATAPRGYHFELFALLVMIFLLVLRAALVPSQPLFTALVGGVCSLPILLGAYVQISDSPPDDFLTPSIALMGLSAWCAVATAATTVVSRVIYGLVTQVRDAQHLGRYTLSAKIGEGGMGEVYRAEHAMLRRPTAVKLLLPSKLSASSLERFEREVQLTSRLSHPNTIAIYDYGRTPDGIFYYAMEYLDGLSLESLVASDGVQTAGRVVHILLQAAGALAEAHGIGLIHRDIKPANIMLCERGGMPDVVKVVDFGLVKNLDAADGDVALTNTNALTGTPLYLAPESITRPDKIDARIDIYALGAVGYFLVTGTPPFTGHNVVEIAGHHLHTTPDAPSARLGRAVPPKLDALLVACLAKDPDARPRDAQALLTALLECETESPWSGVTARTWWSSWHDANVEIADRQSPTPRPPTKETCLRLPLG
ncbi:MAG TPA: serine/threonine-protein kinase [Polyangiaceae bacterium]|nr:serine/threonine-protein kinase [Polyangiaceae bacterium]